MSRVVPAFQIGQNVHRRRPQIWTAFHVNGRRSRWESACFDSPNRRLTLREVAEEVGICKNSYHQILTYKLKMRRVAAKFVPRLLTDAQKENRFTVSQELFECSNADENFLKNVITGDETWVYDYDVETKWSRRSGWENCRPDQKKHVRVAQMWRWCALFFFIGRVSFIMSLFHVVRQSINISTEKFWSVWGWQCEGRGLRRGQTTPGCCTMTMHRKFLTKHETTVVPQPPYSPDLAPADFFLFPQLKSLLKGRRFQTIEEIEENWTRDLRAIPQNKFQDAFQNWKKREWCIKSGGEYFEGDKFD